MGGSEVAGSMAVKQSMSLALRDKKQSSLI